MVTSILLMGSGRFTGTAEHFLISRYFQINFDLIFQWGYLNYDHRRIFPKNLFMPNLIFTLIKEGYLSLKLTLKVIGYENPIS